MDLSDAAVDLFRMLWCDAPHHKIVRWDYPHSSEFVELVTAGLVEHAGTGFDGGRAPGYGTFRPTAAGRTFLRLAGGKR